MRLKNTNSYRNQRVASAVRSALEEILFLGKNIDVRLGAAKCSITDVTISSDLKLITCYFVPGITSELKADDILEALNASKFAIRRTLSTKVMLKYVPEIRFIYDHGFDNSMKVSKILDMADK
jgi:ribosome-binding factor A